MNKLTTLLIISMSQIVPTDVNTQDTQSIWYKLRHLRPSDIFWLYGLFGALSTSVLLLLPDNLKIWAIVASTTAGALKGYIVANDNRASNSLTRSTDVTPSQETSITNNGDNVK